MIVGLRFTSPRRFPAPWCSSSAAFSARGSSTSATPGVALVGDVPRGFAAPGLPDLQFDPRQLRGHRRAFDRTGADRFLADRGRCPRVRRQAPLQRRHQPGVGRPGDVQRRFRPWSRASPCRPACRPARSTMHPERRRPVASLITGVTSRAHPADLRPAVLRSSLAGPRGHHHRCGGVRHDGRASDEAGSIGSNGSISGSRSPRSSPSSSPASWPASSSVWSCRWCGWST